MLPFERRSTNKTREICTENHDDVNEVELFTTLLHHVDVYDVDVIVNFDNSKVKSFSSLIPLRKETPVSVT